MPDTDGKAEEWLEVNRKYAEEWPVLTVKKDPMPEAEEMKGKPNKFKEDFSPEPGEGD